MDLLLLAFLAGELTILSPCILPVLPFVFSGTGRPFHLRGLPLLVAMALSFTAVGVLAVVGGSWVGRAHQFGRMAALLVLGTFGLALLFPAVADRLSQPLVRLGQHLSRRSDQARSSGATAVSSALLGVAIGLLWAPCAGPILGLVLTGAALQGEPASTALLLLAYAAGADICLAIALLAGGRIAHILRRCLQTTTRLRRALGGDVIISVGAIALGLEQASLARFVLADTNAFEQTLLAQVPVVPRAGAIAIAANPLPVLGTLPPFPKGAVWLIRPHSPVISSGARSCLSISGPIPASTAFGPFPMFGPGLRSTGATALW
jgi:cytochrome c biogenesis protein CcdA